MEQGSFTYHEISKFRDRRLVKICQNPLFITELLALPKYQKELRCNWVFLLMRSRPRCFCGVPGCGKSFDRPAKLVIHQRAHSGDRPFVCPTCHSTFAENKHLQVHVLHHLSNELRPFVCTECGKGFVSRQQYDRHVQTHKPHQHYKCEDCDMSFIQKASFLNHCARHRVCDLCRKVCKNERELTRHKLTHHSKRFHCSFCQEKFDSAKALRAHCTETHADILNRCNAVPKAVAALVGLDYEQREIECPHKCGKRFKRKYDLRRHLAKEHPDV